MGQQREIQNRANLLVQLSTALSMLGVMIPAPDFGNYGFGSSKRRKYNSLIGVMILALESEFQTCGDSGSGFGSSKKWNHNTSSRHLVHNLVASDFK